MQKQRERAPGALNRRGSVLERQGETAAQAAAAAGRFGALAQSKTSSVLRTDVASAKIRQTLTSTVTNEEDLKGGVVAAAPDASLAFLDHSTPVKLIGQAFGSFFQLPPAERAATLKALKDVAKHFKKAPNTSVFLARGRAGGTRAVHLTRGIVWQSSDDDVVDGLASTVIRVFAVDGGGADPAQFKSMLAQLFARAGQSPLRGRDVMPDPDSETVWRVVSAHVAPRGRRGVPRHGGPAVRIRRARAASGRGLF